MILEVDMHAGMHPSLPILNGSKDLKFVLVAAAPQLKQKRRIGICISVLSKRVLNSFVSADVQDPC